MAEEEEEEFEFEPEVEEEEFYIPEGEEEIEGEEGELGEEENIYDPSGTYGTEIVLQTGIPGFHPREIPKNQRMTAPFVSKYEKTNIIIKRAEELDANATPLVDNLTIEEKLDSVLIALREYDEGKLDDRYRIIRYYSNGDFESFELGELDDFQ